MKLKKKNNKTPHDFEAFNQIKQDRQLVFLIIFTVWIVLNLQIKSQMNKKNKKKIKVFLQVNVAGEKQKNGIDLNDVSSFIRM